MRLINCFFEDNYGEFWSYLQVRLWKRISPTEILVFLDKYEIELTGDYAKYFESGINAPVSVIIEQRLPWE